MLGFAAVCMFSKFIVRYFILKANLETLVKCCK